MNIWGRSKSENIFLGDSSSSKQYGSKLDTGKIKLRRRTSSVIVPINSRRNIDGEILPSHDCHRSMIPKSKTPIYDQINNAPSEYRLLHESPQKHNFIGNKIDRTYKAPHRNTISPRARTSFGNSTRENGSMLFKIKSKLRLSSFRIHRPKSAGGLILSSASLKKSKDECSITASESDSDDSTHTLKCCGGEEDLDKLIMKPAIAPNTSALNTSSTYTRKSTLQTPNLSNTLTNPSTSANVSPANNINIPANKHGKQDIVQPKSSLLQFYANIKDCTNDSITESRIRTLESINGGSRISSNSSLDINNSVHGIES